MGQNSGYGDLPHDLPRPEDDGAARHLLGATMPAVTLPATTGENIELARLRRRSVIYAYPMTGVPGVPLPQGWNDIPGARGCTPQTLAFKDHRAEIEALGADVYGLSTQDSAYQSELVERLQLPFPILSDADLALTHALDLPTFEVEGKTLLKRLTMIVTGGIIEHVFYPVFPPNEAAATVLAWLARHPATITRPPETVGRPDIAAEEETS